MGAGGVIDGMIKSYNTNRNQFKNRRKPFNSEGPEKRADKFREAIPDKKLSAYEMELFKRRIRAERQKEIRRAVFIIVLVSLVVSLTVWYIGN